MRNVPGISTCGAAWASNEFVLRQFCWPQNSTEGHFLKNLFCTYFLISGILLTAVFIVKGDTAFSRGVGFNKLGFTKFSKACSLSVQVLIVPSALYLPTVVLMRYSRAFEILGCFSLHFSSIKITSFFQALYSFMYSWGFLIFFCARHDAIFHFCALF